MSYTPTNWSTGDTITASAMNKIENGIADAGGGGGWDIVIRAEGIPDSPSSTQLSLISGGSASDLYDKASGGDPVTCLVVEYESSGIYSTTNVKFASVESGSGQDALIIRPAGWENPIVYDTNGLIMYP